MPTVFLSPVWGAGAQVSDNNGNPLSGGKIYTYDVGTTTPKTSYTTSAGTVAHANPIVLDSAGRLPSGGELWLISSRYKFALYTSLNALIGTYDNLGGVGAQAVVRYTGNGALTAYAVTGNVTSVFVGGVYQNQNTYSVSAGTLTFTEAPPLNAIIEILSN